MNVCILLIGDGRDDYRERTILSARETARLGGTRHIEVDDRDHKLGFCGAIQHGWDRILAEGCDWVFHLEEDFVFHAEVPLARMIRVLERHPEIAQIALKRQPWNEAERAAGGIVEQYPDDYTERGDGIDVWTEHRKFFTTNPSVYNARLCRLGWPQEPASEGVFTHRLLADPLLRFAYWGAKHDPPLVEHIGHARAGTRY